MTDKRILAAVFAAGRASASSSVITLGTQSSTALSLIDQFQAQIEIRSTMLRVIFFCRRS
jgi:hypothetical protein